MARIISEPNEAEDSACRLQQTSNGNGSHKSPSPDPCTLKVGVFLSFLDSSVGAHACVLDTS